MNVNDALPAISQLCSQRRCLVVSSGVFCGFRAAGRTEKQYKWSERRTFWTFQFFVFFFLVPDTFERIVWDADAAEEVSAGLVDSEVAVALGAARVRGS